MSPCPEPRLASEFMIANIPRLLGRYCLSCCKEGFCAEYFINRRVSDELISTALVLSYNPGAKDLHVSRFYPELRSQADCKFLSAACFYLMIHHFADTYGLDDSCHISLQTQPDISHDFYERLADFDFHIRKHGLGNVVEVESDFFKTLVDTRGVAEHVLAEGEVPFMK